MVNVMPSDTKTNDLEWRDLINRYLMACWEDQQAVKRTRGETNEQRILMIFGTRGLQRNFADRKADADQLSSQPLGRAEEYTLVQESQDLVIAEVDPSPSGCPMMKSRFRIVRHDGKCFLDDVYWECHCDDGKCFSCANGSCRHCSDGNCSFCNGNGVCKCLLFFSLPCVICRGSGSCLFCKGKGFCDGCEGIGKCTSCSHSDMPGWTSLFARHSIKVPSEE